MAQTGHLAAAAVSSPALASGWKAGVTGPAFLQKALEPSPGPTPLVASVGRGLGAEACVLAVTEGCSHLTEPGFTGPSGGPQSQRAEAGVLVFLKSPRVSSGPRTPPSNTLLSPSPRQSPSDGLSTRWSRANPYTKPAVGPKALVPFNVSHTT